MISQPLVYATKMKNMFANRENPTHFIIFEAFQANHTFIQRCLSQTFVIHARRSMLQELRGQPRALPFGQILHEPVENLHHPEIALCRSFVGPIGIFELIIGKLAPFDVKLMDGGFVPEPAVKSVEDLNEKDDEHYCQETNDNRHLEILKTVGDAREFIIVW